MYKYSIFLSLLLLTLPASAAEVEWPKVAEVEQAIIKFYQPQVDSWEDYRVLSAGVAVAIYPKDESDPVYGAVRMVADTETDFDARLVALRNIDVTDMRFSMLDEAQTAAFENLTRETFSELAENPVPLDLVLENLSNHDAKLRSIEVSVDPPEIFVSSTPAILLQLDGDPIVAPVPGTRLAFVSNSNWPIYEDRDSTGYYLIVSQRWLQSDTITGSWEKTEDVPDSFSALRGSDNWPEVEAALPAQSWDNDTTAPEVFVSSEPAELVVTDGTPNLVPIDATNLSYVQNTESRLFHDDDTDTYYYLASGRWFAAEGLEGPWTFATNNLPEDFQNIPEGSPQYDILVAVPGTVEADLAILQSQIPTEVVVKRDQASLTVEYAGEPEFQPVEGTTLFYAVNTKYAIIQDGSNYYVCHEGIWFESLNPQGPWAVADFVPEKIYEIPPSSPLHYVTYVYIYDSTPDVVYVGYTPGYSNVYVSSGVVVYGTGYYYPPYYGYYGPYPYYYPYYPSYGFYFAYPFYFYDSAGWSNPATGAYGRAYAAYGPYGGARAGWAYNPSTGAYGRGVAAWGPYAAGGVATGFNPETNTGFATRQYANGYERWGSSVIARDDTWARTATYRNEQGAIAGARNADGGAIVAGANRDSNAIIARTDDGDLYAGRDGNVLRRTDDGWSQRDGNDWAPVDVNRLEASGNDLVTRAQGNEFNAARDSLAANRQEQGAAVRGEYQSREARSQRVRGSAPNQAQRSYGEQYSRDSLARRGGQVRSQTYRSRGGFSRGGLRR